MPRIDGKTRVYGILGYPVRHTLSPVIYNGLFDQIGLNAVYVPFEVRPEHLKSALEGLRALNLQGVHLTAPHKEAALPFLDRLSREAEAIGAVNTVLNSRGMLYGDNTDGRGYLRSIQRELQWSPEGESVVLLGAGGAARSIAFALARGEVSRLLVLNRTRERAERLVESLRAHWPTQRFEGYGLDEAAFRKVSSGAALVIDATSPGDENPVDALPVVDLPVTCIVSDINYQRSEPPLLARAASAGLRIHRGLGMLVHQGALSLTLLAGVTVKPETLEALLPIPPLPPGEGG